MSHWERHTCVKFVKYDSYKHNNYVTIQKGQWCASKLGMSGGAQPLYIALGCLVSSAARTTLLVTLTIVGSRAVYELFHKANDPVASSISLTEKVINSRN